MIRVFFSYSHVDEKYRNELEKHLMTLKRQGLVESWHDRRIAPGEEWANRIDEELRRADIILLLVSIDFINSDYCFELEMNEALARHERGEAVVIPVILRPCHWTGLPFGKLQAATRDAKPVEKYPSLDDAFLEITQSIETVVKRLSMQKNRSTVIPSTASASPVNIGVVQPSHPRLDLPRSSNLAIPKVFTDHDKDTFVADAFNFIANFFEGSLAELQKRNPDISARFERVDARSFEAAIYRNGSQVSKCGIWLGNSLGGWSRGPSSIVFSYSGVGQKNSFNENMSVEDTGNMLGLRPMGMLRHQVNEKELLTNEGAAEYFWSMFFEPVQRR
jgi:hypothetical protein